ncbi:MAG: hypothetical protein HONBIEJF_01099 [Fimbriimonadaceae bacterium]|nr:hypothetical protein [Fimbriimonadaceae bacterium]
MQVELLYQPSFTVARLLLEPGEAVRAESGAMLSMSPTITLESKASGGLGKMFGRLLGGESLFQTTFTATSGAGEVLLAPPGPGDVVALQLQNQSLMVTSGCYLAGDMNLDMQTQANLRAFFGAEGLFIMRISGSGWLLLSAFGAIHTVEVPPGVPYIVDTGHLVAFTEGMRYELRKATRGLLGTITSGEGIVAELTGPGRIYIQTRAPQAFAGWIWPMFPKQS